MKMESAERAPTPVGGYEVGPKACSPIWLLAPSFVAMAWLICNAQWFWEHRDDLGFGYGVPVLCAYLFYLAWEKRPTEQLRWSFGSILLAGVSITVLFLIQIYQAAFGTTPASLMGLALGIMLMVGSNLWHVFGLRGVRHFGLAFGFMLLALPMPSAVQSPAVFGLQSLVTFLDVETLKIIGIPAEKVGSVIQLPNGSVGVNEACSGIRSLQATLMMGLFLGVLKLKSIGLRGFLVLAGVGWAVVGNFLRSLFLSYIANSKGTEAVEVYHDSAGWYILVFTLVGVVVSALLLARLEGMAMGAEGGQ